MPDLVSPKTETITPGAVRWDDLIRLRHDMRAYSVMSGIDSMRCAAWFFDDPVPVFYDDLMKIGPECERRGSDHFVFQLNVKLRKRNPMIPGNGMFGSRDLKTLEQGIDLFFSPRGSKITYSPEYATDASDLSYYFNTLGGDFSIRFVTRVVDKRERELERDMARLRLYEGQDTGDYSAPRPPATPDASLTRLERVVKWLGAVAHDGITKGVGTVVSLGILGVGAIVVAVVPDARDAVADLWHRVF